MVERHWHFEGCYTAKPLSSSRKRHKNIGFWKQEGNKFIPVLLNSLAMGQIEMLNFIITFVVLSTFQGGFISSWPAIISSAKDVRTQMKTEEKSKHNVRPIISCEPGGLFT